VKTLAGFELLFAHQKKMRALYGGSVQSTLLHDLFLKEERKGSERKE